MPGQLFFCRRCVNDFKEQVNPPAYLNMFYKENFQLSPTITKTRAIRCSTFINTEKEDWKIFRNDNIRISSPRGCS